MKITTEKELRESVKEQIERVAKQAAKIVEEKEPDKDFDPSEMQGVPKKLAKLLDPDISPQRFAALDAELDEKGSPQHQAFALLAFALTYADRDVKQAQTLLKKAVGLGPKVQKMMEKSSGDAKDSKEEGGKTEGFTWKK